MGFKLAFDLSLGQSGGFVRWWDSEATWAYEADFKPNGRAMRDGQPLISISALLDEGRATEQTVTDANSLLSTVAALALPIGAGVGAQIEGASTNHVLKSIDYTGEGGNVTFSNDGSLDAFGQANLTKVVVGAGSPNMAKTGHIFGTTVAACSWVVKRGNFDSHSGWRFGMYDATAAADKGYITFDFSTGLTSTIGGGTVASHGAIPLANDCWRIWALISVVAGNSHNLYSGAVGAPITTGHIWYLGDRQAEDDRVTPIIRTTGSAVTRDESDITAVADGSLPFTSFSATAGTFVIEVDLDQITDGGYFFSFSDDTTNEHISALISTTAARLLVVDGGVSQTDITTGTLTTGRAKIAFAWAAGDFAICVDGGTVVTDASGTLPTVTGHNVGMNETGDGAYLNDSAVSGQYFPARLSNSRMQELTA